MNASRTLRPPREWRLIFLSTGEISIEQKIEEEKHQVSPGQRLRMLDIPIGEGIIENPHGQSEERFVTALKQDCADYFGTAGLEFIGALIRKFETFVEFQLSVKQRLETATMELPDSVREKVKPLVRHYSQGLINVDPPDHSRMRQLVQKAFTPRTINSLTDYVSGIVERLIDAVADKACDRRRKRQLGLSERRSHTISVFSCQVFLMDPVRICQGHNENGSSDNGGQETQEP